MPRDVWLRIWNNRILRCHKLLWWQLLNDCFPTRLHLNRFSILVTYLVLFVTLSMRKLFTFCFIVIFLGKFGWLLRGPSILTRVLSLLPWIVSVLFGNVMRLLGITVRRYGCLLQLCLILFGKLGIVSCTVTLFQTQALVTILFLSLSLPP